MAPRVISSSRDCRLNERLEHALAGEGLQLVTLHDPRELARALLDPDVRVGVLDSRVPGLDVIEVLGQATRAGMRGECVVLHTDEDEWAGRARAAGAREVVSLPAQEEIIVQAVRLAGAHAERTHLLMEARRHRSRLRRIQYDLEADMKRLLLAPGHGINPDGCELGSAMLQARHGAVEFCAFSELPDGSVEAAIGSMPSPGGLETVLDAAHCKQLYLQLAAACREDMAGLLADLNEECTGGVGGGVPRWTLLRLRAGDGRCSAVTSGSPVMAQYSAERSEWTLGTWEDTAHDGIRAWNARLAGSDLLVVCSRDLPAPGGAGAGNGDGMVEVLWDTNGRRPDDIAQAVVAAAARRAGGVNELRDDITCLVGASRQREREDEAHLQVDRHIEELLRVRSFCRDLAGPVLDSEETSRLVLAADEAMSNIVRHAGRSDMPVELRGTRDGDCVRVEFRYAGPAFEPSGPAELPRETEPYPEGGYGLYIIDRSVDEVEYYQADGVNCIRLTVEAEK